MKLNLISDYALRLLMSLAVNDTELVTIAEIANRYEISKNHLMKVAHKLGQFGIIETVRGRSGGLRLAQPDDRIFLGDVIRKMEDSSVLVECFPGGKGSCKITRECRLKVMLYDAEQAFYAHLNQFTLADLTHNHAPLKLLLEKE